MSIMQAILAVLTVYAVLAVFIGLAIVWSAFHPSFDCVWVICMLVVAGYLVAGEMFVP